MLLLYMKQPHKNIVFYKSWMSMKQENMVGNFNYLIGHQASQIVKEQAPRQNSNETSSHWLKTKKGDYLYSNLLLGTYNPNDISQTEYRPSRLWNQVPSTRSHFLGYNYAFPKACMLSTFIGLCCSITSITLNPEGCLYQPSIPPHFTKK